MIARIYDTDKERDNKTPTAIIKNVDIVDMHNDSIEIYGYDDNGEPVKYESMCLPKYLSIEEQ